MLNKQKTGAILNERLTIKEGGTGKKRRGSNELQNVRVSVCCPYAHLPLLLELVPWVSKPVLGWQESLRHKLKWGE